MQIPFDNQEIQFIRKFGTQRGRWLANRLNLCGKNSEKLANSVSAFFWNLTAAISLEKVKQMKADKSIANNYLAACKIIYKDMLESEKYFNLPNWVLADLQEGIKFVDLASKR